MKALPTPKRPGDVVHVQDGPDRWHVGQNPCSAGSTTTHLTPSLCKCRWYETEEQALEAVGAWPHHDLDPIRTPTVPDAQKTFRHMAQLLDQATYNTPPLYGEDVELRKLDRVTSIIEAAEVARQQLIDNLRTQNVSWTRIGQSMGMTKQAAQQRYGAKPKTTVRNDPDQLSLTD